MKIWLVGAELYCADWWTGVTKLIVAYRDFAYVPKSNVRQPRKTAMTTEGRRQLAGERSRCRRRRFVK